MNNHSCEFLFPEPNNYIQDAYVLSALTRQGREKQVRHQLAISLTRYEETGKTPTNDRPEKVERNR